MNKRRLEHLYKKKYYHITAKYFTTTVFNMQEKTCVRIEKINKLCYYLFGDYIEKTVSFYKKVYTRNNTRAPFQDVRGTFRAFRSPCRKKNN